MAFCKNCGHKLANGQPFCSQCGTNNSSTIQSQPTRMNETRQARKVTLSKKAKFLILTAVILVVALVGAHLYLSSQFKPEKVVSSFENAVKNKDKKQLVKMINDGQQHITVKESDIDGYLDYLTKENDFPELMKELGGQAVKMKNDVLSKPVQDEYGNGLFRLAIADEKKWGIYKQYVVQVIPFTVHLTSNIPETKFSINGQKAKTLKDDYVEMGQLLPGKYKVTAEYKGEYSTLKAEETLDFTFAEDNVLQYDIALDGAYITVFSNYEDAKLFVNGKDTNLLIEDAIDFGPLATDGSVKIHAERTFPTGVKKSETVTVKDDSSIDLDFEEAETEAVDHPQKALQSFMSTYISQSMRAINNENFSYVSDYYDPSGPAYKESKDYLEYLKKKGIKEDNLKVEVKSYEIVDSNTFKVNTFEEYNIYYSGEDGPTFKAFNTQYLVKVDKDGDMKMYQLIKTEEIK